MKCDNFDRIVLYIDGVLSDQASQNLKNHMDACEDCRKIFDALISTKELLKGECIADKKIDIKVLNTIDKSRYVDNNKFRLLHRLNTLKIIVKPVAAIFLICCITFLFLSHGRNIENTLTPVVPEATQNNSEAVNILILGKDGEKNCDAIILINYDPGSAKLNLLSIPRDTSVNINGVQTKLNGVYLKGGPDLMMGTVGELLKVNIQYYVCFYTETVEKFVDILDGVDFEIASDMNYDDPIQNIHINLKKGKNHLSGDQVVQFLLYRKPNDSSLFNSGPYDGSDLRRIEAQQSMLRELIKQKTDVKYISRINKLADAALENSETNITIDDCLRMVRNISGLNPNGINMFVLPVSNQVNDSLFFCTIDKEAAQSITNEYFQTK